MQKNIFQMHSNQNKVSMIPSYTNFTFKARIHFSQNKKTDQMMEVICIESMESNRTRKE